MYCVCILYQWLPYLEAFVGMITLNMPLCERSSAASVASKARMNGPSSTGKAPLRLSVSSVI